MTDMIFDPNEQTEVEAVAKRRGYAEVRAYLLNLINADAVEHGEEPPFDDDIDDDDDYVREAIKQGLRDALNGNVLTEEEFWKAVGDDE